MRLIILIFVGFVWLQKKGYDLWYDLEICVRAKAVINELKGENKMLKKEMKKLKGENKMFKIKCIVVFFVTIFLFVALKHM